MRAIARPKRSVPRLLFPHSAAPVYTQGFADETQWELHAGAGTIANDDVNYRTEDGGTRSQKVTTDGNTISAWRLTAGAVFAAGTFTAKPQYTDFWVFIQWSGDFTNFTKLATTTAIQIEFSSSQNLNNAGWTAAIDDSNLVRGWNHLVIHGDDWTRGSSNPALDWSDIISIRIRCTRNASLGLVVNFDALRCYNQQPQPAVVLNFPDSNNDHFLYGFPVMKRYGFRGTYVPVVGTIGGAGAMTYRHLIQMQTKGSMIGNQSQSGALNFADKQLTQDDLTDAYDNLVANGLKARNARFGTFPSNAFDEQALDAVDEADTVPEPDRPAMLAMMGGGAGNRSLSRKHSIPNGNDHMNSMAWGAVSSSTVDDLKTAVNNAIQYGNVIRIGFHGVVQSGAAADEFTVSNFRAFLQWLRGRNIPVITEAEMYDLQTQGVVIPQPRRIH